jgi:hypothetical protein
MSLKITFPWQSRLTVARSGSPGSGRKNSTQPLSTPLRSVTMQEDDLDHLGAMHHVSEHQTKRKWFGKWF